MAATSGRITGKTVLVTGANRGIGLGLVKRFLERSNKVVATTRQVKDCAELQELQKSSPPGQLTISELDISQPASIQAWAMGLRSQAAISHLDIVVNNAGTYGRLAPLLDVQPDDLLQTFQTNAMGPFLVTQQLLSQGLLGCQTEEEGDKKGGGEPTSSGNQDEGKGGGGGGGGGGGQGGGEQSSTLLIHMSTVVSSHGDTTVSGARAGNYGYRASKAALNILHKALSIELAPKNITSTLFHPGYVQTDMNGGQGWISVEESSAGILAVLESGQPLAGRFLSYDGKEIPW